MPDMQFNHPSIDLELLPCSGYFSREKTKIMEEVSAYFRQALQDYIWLKKRREIESSFLVVHRVFAPCIFHHHDTKTASKYIMDSPQAFYLHGPHEPEVIPYTGFMVERNGFGDSWPAAYFIKCHHDQALSIGYSDSVTREYFTLWESGFQEYWVHLVQRMLQIGFLSFLHENSESLTSAHVRELLSRNLPRLGEDMMVDIEKAIHIKQ